MIFIGEKNAEQTYSEREENKDSSLTFIPVVKYRAGLALKLFWIHATVIYTQLTDSKTVRSLRVDYTGNFGSVSHCEEICMCLQRNPHRRITEKLPYPFQTDTSVN